MSSSISFDPVIVPDVVLSLDDIPFALIPMLYRCITMIILLKLTQATIASNTYLLYPPSYMRPSRLRIYVMNVGLPLSRLLKTCGGSFMVRRR